MNPNDIPPTYMTDWNGWGIALVAVASVATLAWFLTSRRTLAWVNDIFDDRAMIAGNITWGVLTLAGMFGLLYLPGAIMRHLPSQQDTGWVLFGAIAAGVALGIWAAAQQISYTLRILPWIPLACLVLGTVIGFLTDAISRFAASIPTSVPAALALIGLVALAIIAWARSQ